MVSALARASASMRALRKESAGDKRLVIAHIDIPEPPPGFARIKVLATGICGTDRHIAAGEYASEPPVVLGHEVAGYVECVGAEPDAGWLGQRVVCETYFSTCERCIMCRTGRRNLCTQRRSIGSFEDGGFAEFLVVPMMNLHIIPGQVSDHDAVLFEPLACVVQCLECNGSISASNRVLITGPGAMGQLAARVALAHGADVTVAGLPADARRLERLPDRVNRMTGAVPENSFDVVIECSGSEAALRTCLESAAPGARYIQVGIFGKPVRVPIDHILYKELTVTSGFASTPMSWRNAITLVERGLVSLRNIVTETVDLTSAVQRIVGPLDSDQLKIAVVP